MASRAIVLQGHPIINEKGVAAEEIIPGMLVEGVDSVERQDDAGGPATRTFALEQDMLGKDIDEVYAIGDQVQVGSFSPGDVVNALIASGQNITAGQFLEPAGNGTLRAYAAGTRIGRAMESVNNDGSGTISGGGLANLMRLRTEIY